MKKIFSILMVALVATAMFSCTKDEDAGFEEANVNEAVINGVSYNLKVEGIAPVSNFYTLYGWYPGEDGRLFTLECNLWNTCFNKTFDLTKLDETMVYNMYLESDEITEFELQNTMVVIYGRLGDGQGTQNYSPFSTGKCKVTVNDSGVTCSVNGTLKDGTTLKYKIFVPTSDITNS